MSVYPTGADVTYDADLSECGSYRYRLTRCWSKPGDGRPRLLPFLMLNPSTADATVDDPTIRRCVGFARREGYDGIEVVNLYAFRATKPSALWECPDPIGPRNDQVLRDTFAAASTTGVPVIAAWGTNAKAARVQGVLGLPHAATALHHLGLTKHGAPKHPLYLPSAAPLVRLV